MLEAGGHGGVARLERVRDRPEPGRDDIGFGKGNDGSAGRWEPVFAQP